MYRSPVVPLDGSAFAEQALPIAAAILRPSKASLTLLRVHRPVLYKAAATGQWDVDQREAEGDYLARVAARMSESVGVKVQIAVR